MEMKWERVGCRDKALICILCASSESIVARVRKPGKNGGRTTLAFFFYALHNFDSKRYSKYSWFF